MFRQDWLGIVINITSDERELAKEAHEIGKTEINGSDRENLERPGCRREWVYVWMRMKRIIRNQSPLHIARQTANRQLAKRIESANGND